MQNEITVSPLVDILSEQLGEQVVMNGNDYVYYAGLLKVEQPKVEVALLEQQRLYDEEVLNARSGAIEAHIYSFYPQKKQAQDEKWISYYTTVLKAQAIDDLESKIVVATTSFFNEESFLDVTTSLDEAQMEGFMKLLEIAVKTQWARLVIDEGKLSIEQNREPVYTQFPEFD